MKTTKEDRDRWRKYPWTCTTNDLLQLLDDVDFVQEIARKYAESEVRTEYFRKVEIPDCTCDEPGESSCPRHWRENQLQDRAIAAENKLVATKEDLQSILNIGRIDAEEWTQDVWRDSIQAVLDKLKE